MNDLSYLQPPDWGVLEGLFAKPGFALCQLEQLNLASVLEGMLDGAM